VVHRLADHETRSRASCGPASPAPTRLPRCASTSSTGCAGATRSPDSTMRRRCGGCSGSSSTHPRWSPGWSGSRLEPSGGAGRGAAGDGGHPGTHGAAGRRPDRRSALVAGTGQRRAPGARGVGRRTLSGCGGRRGARLRVAGERIAHGGRRRVGHSHVAYAAQERISPLRVAYVETACGKATGLGLPCLSTARSPNWTLSLEMSRVTEVTLPTSIWSVQSAAVVSRITTR